MKWLEMLARLGGRRVAASSGLVRLRDALSLIQAALALAAVTLAQSASSWAVALTIALAAVAMVRPLPQEVAGKTTQRLWTSLVGVALMASGIRTLLGAELLVSGVDFLLLLVVQRLFNRQRCREHMQLLMLGSVLMVIAAVIDAELHYPILLALYLPTATLALIVNHLLSEGERLGRRVEFEVDRYGTRELSRLSRSALQVALIAAVAGLVTFLAFPRFGVGVFLRGNLYGNESVGFSDTVRLGGFGTIKNDATVVMHLVPLDSEPSSRPTWHLRGSAFAKYEAGRWTRSRDALSSNLTHRRAYDLLDEHGRPPGEIVAAPYRFGGRWGKTLAPHPVPGFAAAQETVRVLVTMEDIGTDLLFAAGRPLAFSLTPRGAIEGRNRLGSDLDDQVRVLDRQPGPIQYEFVGRIGEPTREELQAIGDPSVPAELGAYVEVELSDEFEQLALEITAGANTRLEKVEAVQRYLLQNYEYSLEQPLSDRVRSGELDPVEGFLFDTKAGHCEYFATAMALLLREVEVPTRNVNGFYGAHYNAFGDFYAVRQADAHSWVEVYFEQLGWVTFDPTPPGGRTAGDDAPWFPRLAALTDALRNAYLEYVIDYDLTDQLAMLEQIGVERRGLGVTIDWRRFAPWLGGMVGIVAIGLLTVRLIRRRRSPTRPEVAIYLEVLALMQRRGRGRREHESASAWASRLSREHAPEASVLGVFARLYDELRFGERAASSDELARMRELAEQLRRN
jgi:transglutaminase-like putative cysteine protease